MQTFNLSEIKKRIFKFRDDRNWMQFHSPKNLAVSIAIEAGELLEHFQWKADLSPAELEEKREAIGDEVADILVYLIEFADVVGLDLERAVLSKLAKNEQKYPVEKAHNSAKKYTEL